MLRIYTFVLWLAFAFSPLISSIVSAESSIPRLFHSHSQFLGAKTITVALVQLDSDDVGNWDVLNARVAQAKAGGAEIVVFPESSNLGWLNPSAFETASPIPGPVTDSMANIAVQHNVWIAFGTAERGPQVAPSVYLPFDAGVVINPSGDIVLHSRKFNVLKNAFNPANCPPAAVNPGGGCNYHSAPVSNITVMDSPLGKTAILVCADAYTYDTAALDRVKSLGATAIIVVWGVTAGQLDQCGASGFNAVEYASQVCHLVFRDRINRVIQPTFNHIFCN